MVDCDASDGDSIFPLVVSEEASCTAAMVAGFMRCEKDNGRILVARQPCVLK